MCKALRRGGKEAFTGDAGSVEENNLTGIRARAMQRGQCSSASHRALGLMLSPQREQFRNTTP